MLHFVEWCIKTWRLPITRFDGMEELDFAYIAKLISCQTEKPNLPSRKTYQKPQFTSREFLREGVDFVPMKYFTNDIKCGIFRNN